MNTSEFLLNHRLSADSVNIEDVCRFFMDEMKNGLEKKPSSLDMIDSFCSPAYKTEPGKPIIVIDAGGTNFRTCLVSFDEKMNPLVSDFQNTKMPGSDREVTAREFFGIIADATERLIEKSDRIGFCFSYAARILENHDGIVSTFSKEIKASEVIGKRLGQELFAEFARRGYDVSKKKIIILNDTVTTLLAGLSEVGKYNCEGCVGFILGTGTNTAYIEKNTIINVESGGLNFSIGDIDDEFFAGTKNPDYHKFEKLISGAYIGPGLRLVFKHAVEEGLLSSNCLLPEDFQTYMLDDLHFDDGKDDKTANEIIDSYIERSAKLTAANLAASILFTEYGKDKPVLINADGTTFYKLRNLKHKTEEYLSAYLAEHGRRAVFTKIDQSPIIGSAIGALSL